LAARPLPVSVIVTVYNESQTIRRLLDSLARQHYRPDEVVICDGGSTDDTVAIIAACAPALPNLRLLIEPGANISRGRNRAIELAAGPIIAVTDAGVWLAEDWLEKLVEPWRQAVEAAGPDPAWPLAAAGFFLPDAGNVFQIAMAATVLPLHADVDPQHFLPSSRSVAFLKSAWAEAGGYPEWLDYCEDLLFDFALNGQRPGQPSAFVWAPGAVAHFRPRSSFGSFWRQYYRYARGDGKADLWRKRHAIRYVTYLMALPSLLFMALAPDRGGSAVGSEFTALLGRLGLLAGMVAYCARPWQRVWSLGREVDRRSRLQAAALVPAIRAWGDLAKMAGYPVGLWWRWRNRHRPEIHWRRTPAP
jgi:glycosyltransferase involved in cell wall biosynthesis